MTSIVADVAKHYDDLDSYYRQLWGDHLHHGYWARAHDSTAQAVHQLIDELVQPLNVPAEGRVCDVGCGYGSSLRYLRKSKGWNGVGFTVSPLQAAYANDPARSDPHLDIRCQDWMTCDLPNDSVDGLYAIESTEHMPSFESFLSQAHRVLKPGKRLAIAAWLRDPNSSWWQDRYLNDKIVSEGRLAQMMYTDEFTQTVAQRFRIVSVRDVSVHVRKTWWQCAWKVAREFCSNSAFRKKCFDPSFDNRIFVITVFRILFSYYLGSMRYYLLVAEKS